MTVIQSQVCTQIGGPYNEGVRNSEACNIEVPLYCTSFSYFWYCLYLNVLSVLKCFSGFSLYTPLQIQYLYSLCVSSPTSLLLMVMGTAHE